MSGKADLIVRIGQDEHIFGIGVLDDWLVRHRIDAGPDMAAGAGTTADSEVYGELKTFLGEKKKLFETLGKVVVVTDIAERFQDSLGRESNRIGYIRLAPDSYTPEYMTALLERNGGRLITKHVDPRVDFDQELCEGILRSFSDAGVTDIAVHSMYQIGSVREERRIIEICEALAPGRFTYHSLDMREYTSFLLAENRLLINVCIRGLLRRELEEIERACRMFDTLAPTVILDGSGYCIDSATALGDPLSVWQGGYAAAMMGAARQYGVPEAVVVAPYTHIRSNRRHAGGIIIDKIKGFKPVTSGRTKRFFNFQVAGPFPGAVGFPEIPYRHRLMEAIRSVNTSHGPLPVLDLTGGNLDLQDLDYPVYIISDFDSALLTGAQAAEFRKSFDCLVQPSEDRGKVEEQLLKAAETWLGAAGLTLADTAEEFSGSSSRYMNTEREKITLTVTGHLSG